MAQENYAVTFVIAVSLEPCFRLLCEGVQGSEPSKEKQSVLKLVDFHVNFSSRS